jgi:hypothetical protein
LYSISIIRTTANNGPDFSVYWRTSRYFWDGLPVYSAARDGMMTFKYPPWIFPLFMPFGLLPLSIAKVCWGLIEAGSLFYLMFWLTPKVSLKVLGFCLILFSGIWTVHAFDGQVSLPLLASSLALFSVFKKNLRGFKGLLLTYFLSIKIFTLFPVLGLRRREGDVQRIFIVLFFLLFLSIPAFYSTRAEGGILSWLSHFFNEYQLATAPGLDVSGRPLISIVGGQAQGWGSFIFRIGKFDLRNQPLILGTSILLGGLFAILWTRGSTKLNPEGQWVGWLGLMATLQPLAGFHTFVLSFPVAAMTLQGAVQTRKLLSVGLSVLSILMITAMSSKTLGPVGEVLQFCSVKSWGVLICLVLLRAMKTIKVNDFPSKSQYETPLQKS